ncbi:unnamed protein product [Schistosoma curassoni]|uniref:Calpain catalytic domain-containing protein n=1 Tax=Schistosoma curassoni TaxID=6186 RepID=A0A183JNY3_9TREM|nr:unnamed protein product [Schistosoma curassoni]
MSVASKQYETLVKRLKTERTLWEDPDFPANDYAIGNIPNFREKIEWKRPHEINPNAKFFAGGASRFDIEQGALEGHFIPSYNRNVLQMHLKPLPIMG